MAAWEVARLPILAIWLVCLVTGSQGDLKLFDEETRLQVALFTNYDRNLIPVTLNLTAPVTVRSALHINKIIEVDVMNDLLKLDCWLALGWRDQRLQWDSRQYGGITVINVNTTRVWLPDITLYYSLPQLPKGYNTKVVLNATGHAWLVVRMLATPKCEMSLRNFPHDEQECRLYMGSWYHGWHYRRIKVEAMGSRLSFSGVHQDWEVVNASRMRIPEYASYMGYMLHLRRKASYYTYMYVTPPLVLAMLTPMLFALQQTGPHRTTLGIGIIISLCFVLGNFDWLIPGGEGEIPRLGEYHVGALVVAILSTVFSILIASLLDRTQAPPNIIQRVVGELLGSILCVSDSVQSDVTMTKEADGSEVKVTDTAAVGGASWVRLAAVLDRAAFIIFSLIVFIMTLVCLV